MSYYQLFSLLQTDISNQLTGNSVMISIFPFSHLSELLQVGWRFAEKLLFTAKSAGNERTTQIPIVALPKTNLYYYVAIFKNINMQSPHTVGQPLIV